MKLILSLSNVLSIKVMKGLTQVKALKESLTTIVSPYPMKKREFGLVRSINLI